MQKISRHSGGETITLLAGDYRAQIVSVGAGLAQLTCKARHLVIPHDPCVMPLAHLGKVLLPWPNRLAGGRYQYAGQAYQLPVNEPGSGAAIHGLVAWRDWQVIELTATKVVLALFLPPGYGYPFSLMVQAIYSLNEHSGLSVRIISENCGDQKAPYGAGVHPYLTCNLTPVDKCLLQLPARQVIATQGGDLCDAGALHMDYSQARQIGEQQIDHTFRASGEQWEVKLIDAQLGRSVNMRSDQPWIQIYSGEKLNRQGLAVEPMSCPPDAFNSKINLIELSPGQQHCLFFNIFEEQLY